MTLVSHLRVHQFGIMQTTHSDSSLTKYSSSLKKKKKSNDSQAWLSPLKWNIRDFPGGTVVKNSPANAGDTVLSLVWEDPTCHKASKPASHNYWARTPRAHAPQQEKPSQWEAQAPQQSVVPARHN